MCTNKPYDEEKTLQLLAQGSDYAFTQLFSHYSGRIFHVALRFLKCRESAEEVVQEIFLKVWIRREEMVNAVNFEGYLFTMVRNEVFDRIKALAKETTGKRKVAEVIQSNDGADYPLIEKQYQELLEEAVSQLPPQQKQVFTLARLEGLSHQAIAEQLQLSRLTVKTHMAKALQSIRQNLERHITTFSLLPVILRILYP